ncbi:hypothetical protein [Cutibacterium sp.]|uniref:hypothetical protein n=1 Tax=Cutibacterium sp. TaxID=1912221 RepID=UPI0026DD11B8|nr:hypothetical protein [Cutibacterium sp.]
MALVSIAAVVVAGLWGCGDSHSEVSPSLQVKVTSSAAAQAACRDANIISQAEKLTTSNVDSLKGHKAWACVVGGEDNGDVFYTEPLTQADVDSMKKDPMMADVSLPTGSDCEITGAVTVIFVDNGRVFQHRVVECTYLAEK